MSILAATDIAWLMQRSGAEPGIWLLTVEGPELAGKLYFARNPKPVVSVRNNVAITFGASWFEFEEPGDGDDVPVAKITLPNVDREIGLALEEARSGLTLHFELVREGDPNRVVMAWRMMQLRKAKVDPLVVTGELCAARFEDEPYAPFRVTPAAFPGLYR